MFTNSEIRRSLDGTQDPGGNRSLHANLNGNFYGYPLKKDLNFLLMVQNSRTVDVCFTLQVGYEKLPYQ